MGTTVFKVIGIWVACTVIHVLIVGDVILVHHSKSISEVLSDICMTIMLTSFLEVYLITIYGRYLRIVCEHIGLILSLRSIRGVGEFVYQLYIAF